MDGQVRLSADQLRESLRAEFDQALEGVAAAVNNAPHGRIISGSEWQVKELMDNFRSKVMQRALQMKTDSVESVFSPDRPGQAHDQQGAFEPLDTDGLRKGRIDPPPLAKRRRHRGDAGRRRTGNP